MSSFLKGTLIITNPAINDIPKFSAIAGSAIYIAEHSAEGAIGISLNKSYSKQFAEIAELVPAFKALDEDALLTPRVLVGGPLFEDMPWVLGRNPNTYEKSVTYEDLTLNFCEQAFSENLAEYFSICGLGSFGWGPGQLEKEMANFMWHIIPTTKETLENIPFGDEVRGAVQVLCALKFD